MGGIYQFSWKVFTFIMGGDKPYPRWLRRAYIASYPIAFPLRIAIGITWGVFVVLPISLIDIVADAIPHLAKRLAHEWNRL